MVEHVPKSPGAAFIIARQFAYVVVSASLDYN
jgi:hypothetical protein